MDNFDTFFADAIKKGLISIEKSNIPVAMAGAVPYKILELGNDALVDYRLENKIQEKN